MEVACTHMKLALELSVAPQLHKDDLVEEQPHQVERLRHMVGIVSYICHCSVLAIRTTVDSVCPL